MSGRECTQGLGTEILEAAYGVIANVRDLSALKVSGPLCLKAPIGWFSCLLSNQGTEGEGPLCLKWPIGWFSCLLSNQRERNYSGEPDVFSHKCSPAGDLRS